VLLVEDDARVAQVVSDALRSAGHAVTLARDRACGAGELARTHHDLAIIDVGLPDGSGLDLCRSLRSDGYDLPILILTARSGVEDRVRGLDSGADDYLGKPFATAELVARIRALGRRGPRWTEARRDYGVLVVDRDRRLVTKDGERVPLTPREFDIVALLAWRDGRVVARDEILEVVWGDTTERAALSLDVLIARIRRKLGARDLEVIRTVRQVGYAWALTVSKPV
jgi:DNA-binding response OmpR family regulator